jgi:hypothetical protein
MTRFPPHSRAISKMFPSNSPGGFAQPACPRERGEANLNAFPGSFEVR